MIHLAKLFDQPAGKPTSRQCGTFGGFWTRNGHDQSGLIWLLRTEILELQKPVEELFRELNIRCDKGLDKGRKQSREEGAETDNFRETIDTTWLIRSITVQHMWLFLWTKRTWWVSILGPGWPNDMAVGKSLHLLDLHFPYLSKKNNNILPAILYELERIYNFVSRIEMAVIIIFY